MLAPPLASRWDAAEHKALNDKGDDRTAVNASVTGCLLDDHEAGRRSSARPRRRSGREDESRDGGTTEQDAAHCAPRVLRRERNVPFSAEASLPWETLPCSVALPTSQRASRLLRGRCRRAASRRKPP